MIPYSLSVKQAHGRYCMNDSINQYLRKYNTNKDNHEVYNKIYKIIKIRYISKIDKIVENNYPVFSVRWG